MFVPNPLQVKAMLIAGLVMALACVSLLALALYWRGEYREAKAAVVALTAQTAVLGDKIEACSAGTDQTKRVGDAAIAAMTGLVAEARKANRGREVTAATLEEIARQARQPGEGCDWAWAQIEEQKRKARAAP